MRYDPRKHRPIVIELSADVVEAIYSLKLDPLNEAVEDMDMDLQEAFFAFLQKVREETTRNQDIDIMVGAQLTGLSREEYLKLMLHK